MIKCLECDSVFESPKIIYERHGQDYPPYEPIYICPVCGSMDICDSVLCDCCGEYTSSPYVATDDGRAYCENCYFISDPSR